MEDIVEILTQTHEPLGREKQRMFEGVISFASYLGLLLCGDQQNDQARSYPCVHREEDLDLSAVQAQTNAAREPYHQGASDLPNYFWARKHMNISMKPTNSPTQGQPNHCLGCSRRISLGWVSCSLFPIYIITHTEQWSYCFNTIIDNSPRGLCFPFRVWRTSTILISGCSPNYCSRVQSLFTPRERYISCFLQHMQLWLLLCYRINPNPRKMISCAKKWPKIPLYPNFSLIGLTLGWGLRRFHTNIHMFSNPTEFGKSQALHCKDQSGSFFLVVLSNTLYARDRCLCSSWGGGGADDKHYW